MLSEALVGQRDRFVIPPLPIVGFVAGYQDYRLSRRINANTILTSERPVDAGLSSFMLWKRLPFTRSTSGLPAAGPSADR